MAEDFIPEASATAPSSLTLLDIVKAFNSTTGKEFSTRLINVNTLLSDNISPLFENIQGDPYSNEELGEILTFLVMETLLNKREIIFVKHLVALITFGLEEQGIEIDNKELLENLKIYLKYK